jgi:Protein of unknown function (DUF2934)
MTTKPATTASARKKSAPSKAAASKTAAVTAEIIEDKIAAPAKKRAARKPEATLMPIDAHAAAINASTSAIHPVRRHQLIELAAYYISERHRFSGTSSDEDWLQAEQEVDAMIAAGQFTA